MSFELRIIIAKLTQPTSGTVAYSLNFLSGDLQNYLKQNDGRQSLVDAIIQTAADRKKFIAHPGQLLKMANLTAHGNGDTIRLAHIPTALAKKFQELTDDTALEEVKEVLVEMLEHRYYVCSLFKRRLLQHQQAIDSANGEVDSLVAVFDPSIIFHWRFPADLSRAKDEWASNRDSLEAADPSNKSRNLLDRIERQRELVSKLIQEKADGAEELSLTLDLSNAKFKLYKLIDQHIRMQNEVRELDDGEMDEVVKLTDQIERLRDRVSDLKISESQDRDNWTIRQELKSTQGRLHHMIDRYNAIWDRPKKEHEALLSQVFKRDFPQDYADKEKRKAEEAEEAASEATRDKAEKEKQKREESDHQARELEKLNSNKEKAHMEQARIINLWARRFIVPILFVSAIAISGNYSISKYSVCAVLLLCILSAVLLAMAFQNIVNDYSLSQISNSHKKLSSISSGITIVSIIMGIIASLSNGLPWYFGITAPFLVSPIVFALRSFFYKE